MSGESVGVVFRGSDAGYYRLSLSPNLPNHSAKALLDRVAPNGTATPLGTNSTWKGFEFAQWQTPTALQEGEWLRSNPQSRSHTPVSIE